MKKIIFIIIIITFFTELISAKEKTRMRLLVGDGSVSNYNRQGVHNDSDYIYYSDSEDYVTSASGGEIHFIFSSKIGIGFSSSNTTAEQKSGKEILGMGSSSIDISYLFGDEINFEYGLGLICISKMKEMNVNGVENIDRYEFDTNKCLTYFFNFGIELYDNMEILIGFRKWDVMTRSLNNGIGQYYYSAEYNINSLGLGYIF